ncbi:MAG: hypothetical protein RLZZ301_1330 [Bacteroidota bacterium]|jgi:2-iminobutanoate/2-iminopropanoate deaminase
MPSQKKAIQIPNAPAPVGPYSQAILVGNQLFVSGQIPLNPQSGALEMQTIEQATHRILQNIQALLTEAGFELTNVVKVSIFMKDMNEFQAMNSVYATYFNQTPPARETVQVGRLPLDVNLEMSCIAVK